MEVTIPNGPILTLGMQTGFLYCPWCGVSIRQFYDLVELPELDDRGHFMKLGG